jgi:hypothetical protein
MIDAFAVLMRVYVTIATFVNTTIIYRTVHVAGVAVVDTIIIRHTIHIACRAVMNALAVHIRVNIARLTHMNALAVFVRVFVASRAVMDALAVHIRVNIARLTHINELAVIEREYVTVITRYHAKIKMVIIFQAIFTHFYTFVKVTIVYIARRAIMDALAVLVRVDLALIAVKESFCPRLGDIPPVWKSSWLVETRWSKFLVTERAASRGKSEDTRKKYQLHVLRVQKCDEWTSVPR